MFLVLWGSVAVQARKRGSAARKSRWAARFGGHYTGKFATKWNKKVEALGRSAGLAALREAAGPTANVKRGPGKPLFGTKGRRGHGAVAKKGDEAEGGGMHSEQAKACDAGDENAGDDGDENAGEIEEEQDKKVQGGTASEEAVIASLGWQGGKLRPTRIRRQMDKFSN